MVSKVKNQALLKFKKNFDPERFVREILGARNVAISNDEIHMSCVLPWGLHRGGDQNPSASLNRESLLYNCFTCCSGGDIFWLLQNVFNIQTHTVYEVFRTVGEITPKDVLDELESVWSEEIPSFSIPQYSERIIERWEQSYIPYFTNRNITPYVQKEMRLGIDFNHKDEVFDTWITQPRATIPTFFDGNLVGWQKRKLDERQAGPKYKNSPGFPRDRVIFNYDIAREFETIYVVESVTSVLYMMSLGIRNVVATFGGKITDLQLNLLKGFDEVNLFMDNDLVGQAAAERCAEILEDFTKVWSIPNDIPNSDPANLSESQIHDMISKRFPAFFILPHSESNLVKGTK